MNELVVSEKKENNLNFNPYELALVKGDLSGLSDEERTSYVKSICDSLGINMLTKPFEYIMLNNKLSLYATKAATDQLRQIHKVSITKTETNQIGDIYMVTVYASTPDGRTDCDTGALNIRNLGGDNLANALMKAITKAKRRVTLSICGLGMLDESELDTTKNYSNTKATLIKDEANELKKLGLELRKTLEDMGLNKEEQDAFIKNNNIFTTNKIKELLDDKNKLLELKIQGLNDDTNI
ncbi:hypothetical protein [Campylobacter armoricus]|uniref:Uncharacterized protein n=1 Tax=Campylobacter armoricus TaxID=2505970 RepID=A0A7L5I9W6_9BACT|nr:hypothetical protein [Campylobacter armoricus]QKF79533.1 hypothetical protein CARM_0615 [Campylobacter armoricus]